MEREDARRRTLYLSVVSALVLYLAYLARVAVVPLLVALLLAYVLEPLVAVIERRGFSRFGAVTALFVLFFGSVGTAIVFAVPPLFDQGRALLRAAVGEPARTLASPLPAKLRALVNRPKPVALEDFLRTREEMKPGEMTPEEQDALGNYDRQSREVLLARGEEAARDYRRRHAGWLVGRHRERVIAWDDRDRNGKFDAGYIFDGTLVAGGYAASKAGGSGVATGIEDFGIELVPNLAESVLLHGDSVARGALGLAGTLMKFFAWAVIVPLYTFYFLLRLEDVWQAFVGYLPGTNRDRVVKVLLSIHRMLIGFFRGRILTMVLKGLLVAVLLAVIGAPFWPVFGAAAGLLTIVPAVGPLAVAIPSVVLCYSEGGPTTAGLATGVYLASEVIEGYILIPKLIGKEVGLHPMAVISAILIGGSLLGAFGVVIAIPMAASARIIWSEFVLPALRAKAAEAPAKDPVA